MLDYRLLQLKVSDAANEMVIEHAAFGDAAAIGRLADDLEAAGAGVRGEEFHRRLVQELRARAEHVWNVQ